MPGRDAVSVMRRRRVTPACRAHASCAPRWRLRARSRMAIETWQGDACSLVEAFRGGERSPVEELAATLRGDRREPPERVLPPRPRARRRSPPASPTCRCPFGGVPIGVKELDAGRRLAVHRTRRSRSRDRVADHTIDMVAADPRPRRRRARRPDDGVGVRRRQRHPHRPARHDAQPVAARPHARRIVGRLRGGGRRRHRHAGDRRRRRRLDPDPGRLLRARRPEGTFGRIPLSPIADVRQPDGRRRLPRRGRSATRPAGSTSCNGHDARDPLSLPRVEGWEAGLGTHLDELPRAAGRRRRRLGRRRPSHRSMWELLEAAADELIADCRPRPRRRRRHEAATHGRGVVDQRDDRDRRRARRRSGRPAPTT